MTDETKPAASRDESAAAAADAGTGTVTGVFTASANAEGGVVAGVIADEEGVIAEGAIGVTGEYAIVVAAFADEELARAAYVRLIEREIAGQLDIEGVLVAKADAAGKVSIVKMTDHKTRNGFLVGAVAGAIVGVVFPPAVLASAFWVGMGGAAIGKLGNVAARSAVARELSSVLTPGSSGIVALVRLAQVAEVEKELPAATAVKSAPVSDEAAAAVKEAAKAAGAAPEG